jgi:hypothetical protein
VAGDGGGTWGGYFSCPVDSGVGYYCVQTALLGIYDLYSTRLERSLGMKYIIFVSERVPRRSI